MTFNEFFESKDGHTFLIINIADNLHVKVYKSQNVEIENDNVMINENDRCHDSIRNGQFVEVDELSVYYEWHDDGNIYSIEIFDCDDWKSLEKAYKKLYNISNTLTEMKDKIDDTINLIYYECIDKRWKN